MMMSDSKKFIRVLHICGALETSGGVGGFIVNHYRHINRERIQFDFITHTHTDQSLINEIQDLGGTVSRITPKSENILRNFQETLKLINRKTPHEIIHVHTASTTSFLYLFLAILAKKRVRIVHSHATDLEKPEGSFQHRIHLFLQPLLNLFSTHRIACSTEAGIWLFGNRSEFVVFRNAIDINKFEYSLENRVRYRELMGIEQNFVIGSIGRLSYPKNPEFSIHVLNALLKKEKSAKLLMVGKGEKLQSLKKMITEMKLENNVEFLGVRNDVPELLSAFDAFIFPSEFEGLPLALIEAQTSGVPIFASDSITHEVDISKQITWLSLESTPEYWAEAIHKIDKVYTRPNNNEVIKQAGYDLCSSSVNLEKFYLDALEKSK